MRSYSVTEAVRHEADITRAVMPMHERKGAIMLGPFMHGAATVFNL